MTFLLANGAICLFALMAVVFRKPLCKLIFSAATAVMSLVCCVWLKQLFDMSGGFRQPLRHRLLHRLRGHNGRRLSHMRHAGLAAQERRGKRRRLISGPAAVYSARGA